VADDDVRVPAGWYPDPLGLPQLRWWDNHSWTEHTSDARQPIVEQAASAAAPVAESVPIAGSQQQATLQMQQHGMPQRQQSGQPLKVDGVVPPQLVFADDDPFADDLADLEDTGFPRAAYPLHDLIEPDTLTGATDLPSRREMRAQERLVHDDDVIRDLAGASPHFADPMSQLEAPVRGEGVIADSPAVRYASAARIDDAPRSMRYDLDERHEDLLGEPSVPRSAFAHASSSTTTFIPENTPGGTYDDLGYGTRVDGTRFDDPQGSGYYPAGSHAVGSRAGQHTSGPRRTGVAADPATSTVPAWILTLIPVYMLLVGMVVLLSGATAGFAPITLSLVLGVPWLAGIAIAAADRRSLQHGGMDRPAHWLWALLGAPVYLVARLVATVREAGNGFGPVLTYLVLGLVMVGAVIAVPGLAMELAPASFSAEAERSVTEDARSIGADLTIDCPDTPPLLVQQSFSCAATKNNGDTFNILVSLQRSNGWIDWRVDNWGVFTMGN
jgi:hypothetical protein